MKIEKHNPVDLYFDLALEYLGELSHKEVIPTAQNLMRINFVSGGRKFQIASVQYRGHFGYQVGITKGHDTIMYFDDDFVSALKQADTLSESWQGLSA